MSCKLRPANPPDLLNEHSNDRVTNTPWLVYDSPGNKRYNLKPVYSIVFDPSPRRITVNAEILPGIPKPDVPRRVPASLYANRSNSRRAIKCKAAPGGQPHPFFSFDPSPRCFRADAPAASTAKITLQKEKRHSPATNSNEIHNSRSRAGPARSSYQEESPEVFRANCLTNVAPRFEVRPAIRLISFRDCER